MIILFVQVRVRFSLVYLRFTVLVISLFSFFLSCAKRWELSSSFSHHRLPVLYVQQAGNARIKTTWNGNKNTPKITQQQPQPAYIYIYIHQFPFINVGMNEESINQSKSIDLSQSIHYSNPVFWLPHEFLSTLF